MKKFILWLLFIYVIVASSLVIAHLLGLQGSLAAGFTFMYGLILGNISTGYVLYLE